MDDLGHLKRPLVVHADFDWVPFVGHLRRSLRQLYGDRVFYDLGSFTLPDSDCCHRLFVHLQFPQRAYRLDRWRVHLKRKITLLPDRLCKRTYFTSTQQVHLWTFFQKMVASNICLKFSTKATVHRGQRHWCTPWIGVSINSTCLAGSSRPKEKSHGSATQDVLTHIQG